MFSFVQGKNDVLHLGGLHFFLKFSFLQIVLWSARMVSANFQKQILILNVPLTLWNENFAWHVAKFTDFLE